MATVFQQPNTATTAEPWNQATVTATAQAVTPWNHPAPNVPVQTPVQTPAAMYNPNAGKKNIYSENWEPTPEMITARQEVLAAIQSGEVIPNFDAKFTKWILNWAPPEHLVEFKTSPKSPSKQPFNQIDIQNLYFLMDDIFHGNWSVIEYIVTPTIKMPRSASGKEGLYVISTCKVEVFYPISGTRRVFCGSSDSDTNQQLAANALKSFTIKNAISMIGKAFGRNLFDGENYVTPIELMPDAPSTTSRVNSI